MMVLSNKKATFLTFLLYGSYAFAALLGIDYGQQHIKAMIVSPQAPLEMVLTPEAKRKEISGLAFSKVPGKSDDIERFYGSAVGSLATRFPQHTMLHLKALLGKTMDDIEIVEQYRKEHPGLNIVSTDRNTLAIDIDGVEYPIEELVAMNLQEISKRANSLLKEKDKRSKDSVERLAISVPDFMDSYQRMALLQAGVYVEGLHGLTLISDGYSAAINFALKERNFEAGVPYYYMIYDMGSGSIKASIFKIMQPSDQSQALLIDIQGYGYDEQFGGSQLTLLIADIIQENFLEKNSEISKTMLTNDPKAIAKIVQSAEKAKLILSANSESSISIESLISDIDFRTTITRDEFEGRLQNRIGDITKPIQMALMNQFPEDGMSVSMDDFTGIILSGGSTRVPFVQSALKTIIDDRRILKSINADESVVNGVTLRGVKLFETFKTKPLNVTDRSVFNYTLSYGDNFESSMSIFEAGQTFPTSKNVFIPLQDCSEDGVFSVYENGKSINNVTVQGVKNFTMSDCPFGCLYNVTMSLSQIRTITVDEMQVICLKNSDESTEYMSKLFGIETEKDEDDEFDEFDKEETSDDLLIDTTGKITDGTIVTGLFYGENNHILDLPGEQRMISFKRIKEFNEKDEERFQLQEAKNLLESSLYDARNFLTEENVMANGPQSQLERLADVVTENLEWLEDEADYAIKSEINKRRKNITTMKIKIEDYMESIGEPLDVEQFESLLSKANILLQFIHSNDDTLAEKLKKLEENLEIKLINVREEYDNARVQSYLLSAIANYNEAVDEFTKTITNLGKLVESEKFQSLNREQLYEIKSAFDDFYKKMEEQYSTLQTIQDQRISEVKSVYQKLVRAQKRKDRKLKSKDKKSKKLSDEEDSTSSQETQNTKSSTSGVPKSTASSKKQSTMQHDEL